MKSSKTQPLQRNLKEQGSRNTDQRRTRPKTDDEKSDQVSESSTVADDENDRQIRHRLLKYGRDAENLEEKFLLTRKKKL